jgi:ribosomal protein S11
MVPMQFLWRRDTQHNDNQHNDTMYSFTRHNYIRLKIKKNDTHFMILDTDKVRLGWASQGYASLGSVRLG